MAFYFRADSVPELHGLGRFEQRRLTRAVFMRERMISTLVLAAVAYSSVYFVINPVVHHLLPEANNGSGTYMALLLVWVFALLGIRDVIMMNLLRPKIAAFRAKNQPVPAPQEVDVDA